MSAQNGKIVGLTGGIGSGKSAAAARFSVNGALTLDADAVSRTLLEQEGACYRPVIEAFGRAYVLPDGSIDRKKLAALVFHEPNQLALLNGIVHPAVCEALLQSAGEAAAAQPERLIVLDIPLLFECGLQDRMDAVILVYADDETRIARVMRRDGCTRAEALARMRAQMPQEEKKKLADYIIDNSAGLPELFEQVDTAYRLLTTRMR